MDKLKKQIQDVENKITHGWEIISWMGYLSQKTIRVTFEKDNQILTKDYKIPNQSNYTKFNQKIRKLYYR